MGASVPDQAEHVAPDYDTIFSAGPPASTWACEYRAEAQPIALALPLAVSHCRSPNGRIKAVQSDFIRLCGFSFKENIFFLLLPNSCIVVWGVWRVWGVSEQFYKTAHNVTTGGE